MGDRREHWYRIYNGDCPVCGKDMSFRERVYGPRPPLASDRHVERPEHDTYCGCLDR